MTIDVKRLAVDAGYWRECGAPEDATHWICGFFRKWEDGKEWMWMGDCKTWGRPVCEWPLDEYMDRTDMQEIIPRPQSEWVDGLPPIGVECEVNPHGEWFKVTVRGYGKNKFLAEISPGQTDSDGDEIDGEHAYWTSQTAFRPIPTKAQRDRDELLSAIGKDGRCDEIPISHVKTVIDAAIAAGWTKP